jgi:hypothetical protein
MLRSLFIAGVPCTGKTWLGSWLAEHEGFIHVDAEKNHGSDLDKAGIHDEWDLALKSGRADELAEKIQGLTKPVVLNWGFPPSYLYFVRALQVAGIDTWWIHAKRDLARDAFSKRCGIDLRCFDRQMGEIERHWLLLELVFDNRTIEGLDDEGKQRHPQDLWQEIRSR